MPNQEPAFAWPFGNGPVRVGTQGLFRPCLKTFVAPFLLARLTFSLCLLTIYITRKNVTTIDSRNQGCVITIVLDFNNNNALIVNHSICTYRQDAIQYSLSVIEVIIHIFNWTLFSPILKAEKITTWTLILEKWAQTENFKNAGFQR